MRADRLFFLSISNWLSKARLACSPLAVPWKDSSGKRKGWPIEWEKKTSTSYGKSKSSYMIALIMSHNKTSHDMSHQMPSYVQGSCRALLWHYINFILFLNDGFTNIEEDISLPTFTFIFLLSQLTHLSSSMFSPFRLGPSCYMIPLRY